MSSCTSTPCFRNQGRDESASSFSVSWARSVHRATSRPQLPKRGFTTTGGSTATLSRAVTRCTVRGCGRPAASRTREVWSLSCVARIARSLFRTGMPLASRRPISQIPGSMPSRVGSTSSRESAASPGPSRLSASAGGTSSTSIPGGAAAASLTFVGFSRWETRASTRDSLRAGRPDRCCSTTLCPVGDHLANRAYAASQSAPLRSPRSACP